MKTISMLFFMMLMSTTAFAGLGLPKLGGGSDSGGGANIEASVNDFVGKSRQLAEVSAKSLAAINIAFANEEEAAKKRAEWEAIDKKTDPKERDAAIAKYNESGASALEKSVKSGQLERQVKELSAEKQANVANAAFNLLMAALTAPQMIDDGQKIVSQVSLTNALKVLPVKNALPNLQNFVKHGAGTFAGFAKVLRGAEVKVPEPSLEGKVAEVAI